ncbi:MAG: 2-dehydro-3-deoxygalactonokinase [Proteobacteria bacterium]|nr:2-dehydro-3-deoxygalactonokinase [Pseudomonadota bacterium]
MRDGGLVAIDWGTSNFRAYLLDAEGRVRDSATTGDGILQVEGGDFERVLLSHCGGWLATYPEAPVLLSGMIGSRQGWHEVPYCQCPAGPAEIAQALVLRRTKQGRALCFVPGLSVASEDGGRDVMRGEETQILGAIEPGDGERRLICLPGTHSKWVEVEGGRVSRFSTFMTGEVYGALVKHTILGRLMDGEAEDADAFAKGLALADRQGGFLNHLFRVRTAGLFGELPGQSLAAFLSGIAIGHELAGAFAEYRPSSVLLIGSEALSRRYVQALARRGIAAATAPSDAAARGLYRLARARGGVR